MNYPITKLLDVDIHYIKENLTDRIEVKNIAGISMQEICVNVTDLVARTQEIEIADGHNIYFTFNKLSKLEDREVKEKVLSKSYPNAMRILSDEVFHILNNYVTVPGTIYEIYLIELLNNDYITKYELDSDEDGHTFEYNLIVNLFNDIIDAVPDQRFLSYTNIDFKSIGKMTNMKVTEYNKKEITQWIYNEIDNGKFIIDLRTRHNNPKPMFSDHFVVISAGNDHYIITQNDMVISTKDRIFIVDEVVYNQLFIRSPYGKYNWDTENGTVIRRNENITSYFEYDIIGMINYISENVETPGNYEGIRVVLPEECTDFENYPKIYVDNTIEPIISGYNNATNIVNGELSFLLKFTEEERVHKYTFNWAPGITDVIVFDATNAVILTEVETTSLDNLF